MDNVTFVKYSIQLVAVIVAALACLQYQRILNVDWERVQAFSQNGITWVVNAITHLSNTTHSGTLSNVGILRERYTYWTAYGVEVSISIPRPR